ncbi:sensor histidine kinase [Ktedonobacteria bacterium brp13]|nr:sensor histidine kinase [Ktedonobacteria bacterium brp13]
MHYQFRPLHKLQWQLSLSYILVVVVAMPILLGVALALIALAPSLPPAQQLAQLLTREVSPQVPRPIASQDAGTLNSWLVNFVQGQHSVKPDRAQSVTQLNATETLAVMIFDPAGQLAGSVPIMPARFATGNPARLALFLQKIQINVQGSQQIIQAAFANEQDLAKLVSTQADGQTLVAVPILDNQQRVSGVLFVAVRGLRNISSPLSSLFPWLPQGGSQQLATLLPYALLLILVVTVIGTIVGMLTARRITRRLQRITAAAHAWSIGDFQVHVSDRSPDELGQLAQDLNRMALQVQQLLNTRQQLASLEERQRVARDLHDSVKQQAFALTLLIGAAQSRLPDDIASAQGALSKAGELADQIRQELTAVLQQLRPGALVGQGLQAALRDAIRQWSQQTGGACEFQVSEAPEMPVLRPEIEEALFRMAQEALANAARHSQASQIRVQLEQGTEQVRLHVSDNGKGFAVEQVAGSGHGLANMRDRVEAYGGTLHISSAPGETVVTGCIPFAQETRQQKNKRKRELA